MAGESLDQARLDTRGVVGDRWYAVEDDDGHFASGKDTGRFRRRDAVFGFAAHTEPDGRVVVTQASHCWCVGDPLLDRHLSEAMGTAVRVTPEADVPHQDMGQVSIISTASLRWCRDRWGGSADPRRLRVNVVVTSDEPFVEEGWVGRELKIGSARVLVTERVPRCRMIDIDQDGAVPGVKWLRPLGRERDMSLAVYADVTHPGVITIGDQPHAM